MGRLAGHTASLGVQPQTERFAYAGNSKLIQAVNAASTLVRCMRSGRLGRSR